MAGDRLRNIPTSVFSIIDLRYTNMLQSFGLIRSNLVYQIIYKRPSYYAVQHMVSFFDDEVTAIGEMEHSSDSPRKMSVAGFEKKGKPVVLVWYNDQTPSDELTWDLVSLTIRNAGFNDPVYVEMITGKVYELEKPNITRNGNDTMFRNLPVWDSPVMIADRDLVELGVGH